VLEVAWLKLLIAGLLEVTWAMGLKYTQGFTRPVPSVVTIVAIVASMFLLADAAKTIPIGTAYAVWVGIGATGAAVLGVILLREPLTAMRVLFLGMLVIAIVGLRLTAPKSE
jgi:quaternary ammonium compound-resistance protein SugE